MDSQLAEDVVPMLPGRGQGNRQFIGDLLIGNPAGPRKPEKCCKITNRPMSIAWNHIPTVVIYLRPKRSLNGPVKSWLTPQTSG